MARRARSSLKAPFLRSVELDAARVAAPGAHPFNLPVLTFPDFRLDFTAPVTVIAGPDGSGKSTIVEALACLCGFPRHGGDQDFATGQGPAPLAEALRPAWLPRVGTGFFSRAGGLAAFVRVDDRPAREDPHRHLALDVFGGGPRTERRQGEGDLELFRKRLVGRGVYIFDEPEAALSPARQLEFLRIVRDAERRGDAQFIIATHSPRLMAYPGATLLHLTEGGLLERSFFTTDQFRILGGLPLDPSAFTRPVLPE